MCVCLLQSSNPCQMCLRKLALSASRLAKMPTSLCQRCLACRGLLCSWSASPCVPLICFVQASCIMLKSHLLITHPALLSDHMLCNAGELTHPAWYHLGVLLSGLLTTFPPLPSTTHLAQTKSCRLCGNTKSWTLSVCVYHEICAGFQKAGEAILTHAESLYIA